MGVAGGRGVHSPDGHHHRTADGRCIISGSCNARSSTFLTRVQLGHCRLILTGRGIITIGVSPLDWVGLRMLGSTITNAYTGCSGMALFGRILLVGGSLVLWWLRQLQLWVWLFLVPLSPSAYSYCNEHAGTESASAGDEGAGSGPVAYEDFASTLDQFAKYSTWKEVSTLNYGDQSNACSIVSSIEFDKDGEMFAVGGVTKKIKVCHKQEIGYNIPSFSHQVYSFANLLQSSGFHSHFTVCEMTCQAKLRQEIHNVMLT